jgi:ABC-type enterochelin transport system ATPase subunit
MIEARSLTKTYGAKRAVDSVDFQVKPGMVTGFLGPNSAGKPNIGNWQFFSRVPCRLAGRPFRDGRFLLVRAFLYLARYTAGIA